MSWIWSRGGSGSKKRTHAPLERSESDTESKFVQSDIHDVVNPMTWNNLPEFVRKSLPKWKDDLFSQSKQIELCSGVERSDSIDSPTSPPGGMHSPKSAFGGQQRPPGTVEYTVEEGDTLNTIALRFDMTPSQLAQLNRHDSNTVVLPGMVLYVLDPNRPAPVKPATIPTEPDSRPSQAPPPVVSANSSKGFVEELSTNHMRLKAKYLTKDLGCARGFILLTSQSLIFKPFDDDPLVQETSSVQYEVLLFLQHVVYAAMCVQLEGMPLGSAVTVSPLSPAANALSGIQPPHPLPGRVVRDTSPHPTHKDSFTLDREQPVAGTLDTSNFEEDCSSEGCAGNLSPMADPSPDAYSDDKTAADHPANPLFPDYSVLLLKNLYPKQPQPSSTGPPHSGSSVSAADTSEPPVAALLGRDEVFSDTNRPTSLAGGGSEVLSEKMGGVGGGGGPGKVRTASSSQPSAARGPLSPLSPSLPKFLHLRVSCEANHSFTPMVGGVCIPGRQFKEDFWFAIPDDRVHHLVQFFLQHHPCIKLNSRHEWVDGKFVMVDVDKDNELKVSSNHFGDSSSDQWEVLSFKDIIRKEPLSMQVEKDLPLPMLSEQSHLMSNRLLGNLNDRMILRGVGLPWELGYSTFRDGISLHTLYRRLAEYEDCPNVLVVRDEGGAVFGAVLPQSLRRSERYFGDGETFLFTCQGDQCKTYHWSGQNDFFIKGDKDSFMLGGGDGQCGLWMDEYLHRGSSSPCQTFDNECLATQTDFAILGVEVWCLVS